MHNNASQGTQPKWMDFQQQNPTGGLISDPFFGVAAAVKCTTAHLARDYRHHGDANEQMVECNLL